MESRMRIVIGIVFILLLAAGCSKQAAPAADAHTGNTETHEHHHAAPHGGTLIMIGDHIGHLEVVLDAATGTMTVYALDGEAEQPVRLSTSEITISATLADGAQSAIALLPVEN